MHHIRVKKVKLSLSTRLRHTGRYSYRYTHSFSVSAHERFFAAAADYSLAVSTDGEKNARLAHDLVQSVCALHKHKAFALSQHVLRPYSSRNLDVARRI